MPRTSRRKQHPDEGITAILTMPPSLARLGVLWARHSASSHINLYVTNVPGPPQPLYLAGAQVADVARSLRSWPASRSASPRSHTTTCSPSRC
jgi:WS/DGAT C-terminal domain